MGDGEPDVGDTRELEPPPLIVAGLLDGRLERSEEELRALARDGRDESVLVREVVVRRRWRDARSPGDVAEGEPLGADGGQSLQRGLNERLPEIPVMVGALASTGRRSRHGVDSRVLDVAILTLLRCV
jgi:hypothetical protein